MQVSRVMKVAAAAATLMCSAALAGSTPAQKCEAGKNDSAGRYFSCMAKAEKGLVATGDMTKYGESVAKCEDKYEDKWGGLESQAGGACPTNGDETSMQAFLDACQSSVASALEGNPLLVDVVTCNTNLGTCNTNLSTCTTNLGTCTADLASLDADLTTCEGDLAGCQALIGTLKTSQTSCFNTAGTSIPCGGTGYDGDLQRGVARSFTDNGDGTITDNATGLMWEKLSNDGSIHDFDNTYNWQNAFDIKIGTLNATSFAGYNDWRLPNRFELESLLNLENISPAAFPEFNTTCPATCTVITCSCIKPGSYYWTSTNFMAAINREYACRVGTGAGEIDYEPKVNAQFVRAVRGGA